MYGITTVVNHIILWDAHLSNYFSFFVEPENCSMACGFVLIRLSRLSPCWTPPGFVLDLFMLRRVYNIGNISRKGFLSWP